MIDKRVILTGGLLFMAFGIIIMVWNAITSIQTTSPWILFAVGILLFAASFLIP